MEKEKLKKMQNSKERKGFIERISIYIVALHNFEVQDRCTNILLVKLNLLYSTIYSEV